ncbi:MAG: hypothetical protein LBI80_01255, partial [Endomicrobium sp.]|nr:hypothetical protein [Endomicrobium sp.]
MDNAWEGWKSLDFVKPEHALVFDFSGTHTLMPENPTPGSGGHGTGMAQAFHEMAPEAEVYLIYDLSGFSWSTASSHAMIGYFGSESISLVSASNNMVNTNLGVSLSGSDPLSLFLDECINSSITVCVIAGNYANNTSSFRLEKESGTNNMLFPNGTRDLNIEVSGASPFNIIITRSGFQRLHANYTYQLTNQRTNISVFKLNASPFVSFNSPSDFLANVGDTLTLNIMRLSDTVDYLDIIIGDFGIGKFRLQNPGEMNKASSIALPGASKKAITTGAVLISNYNVKDEISSMSGWGPIPQDVDE